MAELEKERYEWIKAEYGYLKDCCELIDDVLILFIYKDKKKTKKSPYVFTGTYDNLVKYYKKHNLPEILIEHSNIVSKWDKEWDGSDNIIIYQASGLYGTYLRNIYLRELYFELLDKNERSNESKN